MARQLKPGIKNPRSAWMPVPDDTHPVRWESADGRERYWITRDEAIDRLAQWYRDPALALDCGHPVRTPFAWYTNEAVA